MSKVSRVPRAEQWASQIRAGQGKCVESFLHVGELLIKAKSDLPHGEWSRLFEEQLVTFSPRTAQKFMAIANSSLLSNATNWSHLPPSWTTLYVLTKVPEPTLKNALADGVITSDMTSKAVKELLPPKPERPPVESPLIDSQMAMLAIVDAIRTLHINWPTDRPISDLVDTLRHEADRLEKQHRTSRAS